jgi:PAS domain S-box-containing protein
MVLKFYKKQHESEIKDIELSCQYDYLSKYTNDIIILFDENLNIVDANERAITAYGYTRDELLSLKVDDLRSVSVINDILIITGQAEKKGGLIFETVYKRKDGTTFPVEISSCILTFSNMKYKLVIIRDITERKQAEEELKKSYSELENRVSERTAELEKANLLLRQEIAERKLMEQRLTEAMDESAEINNILKHRTEELDVINKELETFSYSVSHDLRAPLRSIDGFSQLLQEDCFDKLDEPGKDYLRRTRAASQHMAQLIDDLLNLSRLSRSEMVLSNVNLSFLAAEIAANLQMTQPERKVEFIITPDLTVYGDKHLLQVALNNLLENAWKFTGKHPAAKIEFGVCEKEGQRSYYVRDNGAGFDMKYADKLFAPFQRLHTPSEFLGTGIGLSTVQRIIHRHRGKVWAEGEVEKGAAIYFTLNTKNLPSKNP